MVGRVRFDPAKSAWMWTMIAAGVIGIPAATRGTLIASALLTVATVCAGHSVGLHRGVIHQTYRCGRITRAILLELGVLTGLGGPLSWVRTHAVRDHWQNQLDCPRYFQYRHSLARDFVWNLHFRFEPADARADARLPAGVLDDPLLRALERTWPLHVLALALVVAAVWGAPVAALVVCARSAVAILAHWFVGYAAHVWGERRYVVAGASESGTNVWPLGIISFGEGFHNNHHAFPSSARMGLRWYELDLGFALIRLLELVGLVHDVQCQREATRAASTA